MDSAVQAEDPESMGEIDAEFEFQAPQFFDFNAEENDDDIAEMEAWFENRRETGHYSFLEPSSPTTPCSPHESNSESSTPTRLSNNLHASAATPTSFSVANVGLPVRRPAARPMTPAAARLLATPVPIKRSYELTEPNSPQLRTAKRRHERSAVASGDAGSERPANMDKGSATLMAPMSRLGAQSVRVPVSSAPSSGSLVGAQGSKSRLIGFESGLSTARPMVAKPAVTKQAATQDNSRLAPTRPAVHGTVKTYMLPTMASSAKAGGNNGNDSAAVAASKPKEMLTRPQAPNLATASRKRAFSVMSTEERVLAEIEASKNKVRRPNPSILNSMGNVGVPMVQRLPPTIPQTVQFETDLRLQARAESHATFERRLEAPAAAVEQPPVREVLTLKKAARFDVYEGDAGEEAVKKARQEGKGLRFRETNVDRLALKDKPQARGPMLTGPPAYKRSVKPLTVAMSPLIGEKRKLIARTDIQQTGLAL